MLWFSLTHTANCTAVKTSSQIGHPMELYVCLSSYMWNNWSICLLYKHVCVSWHMLPAAARRQPAVPRRCSSLCRSGSTPAGGGTSGGRSTPHTSWWWAWRTSDLWTLPCPEHHTVTAGSRDSEGTRGVRHGSGRCSYHGNHMVSVSLIVNSKNAVLHNRNKQPD